MSKIERSLGGIACQGRTWYLDLQGAMCAQEFMRREALAGAGLGSYLFSTKAVIWRTSPRLLGIYDQLQNSFGVLL